MTAAGLSVRDAKLTADVLIRTDMRGIYTHGTVALRRYVQLMRDGGIDVDAVPAITEEGPAWARDRRLPGRGHGGLSLRHVRGDRKGREVRDRHGHGTPEQPLSARHRPIR